MIARAGGDDAKRASANDTPDRELSITELCQEFDVSTRTLRFYEERGLLRPIRKGGVRYYREDDRQRIMIIMDGRRLGFTLTDISQILEGSKQFVKFEENLTKTQISQQLNVLERQRDSIEAAISRLKIRYKWICDLSATSGTVVKSKTQNKEPGFGRRTVTKRSNKSSDSR